MTWSIPEPDIDPDASVDYWLTAQGEAVLDAAEAEAELEI